MKLTNKDKNYLISIGYLTEDFNEIENATRTMFYEMFSIPEDTSPHIPMTQKQVIEMLGRETFLSGVGRATFHTTAIRSTESRPYMAVYFERKKNNRYEQQQMH